MIKLLLRPRIRLLCLLLWWLAWPVLAAVLLTPLPGSFLSHADLLGHFVLFAAMTLAVITFARSGRQIITLALLTIAYGVALEIAQGYVPYRTFDLADGLANIIGGAAGGGLALMLYRWWLRPAWAVQARLGMEQRA